MRRFASLLTIALLFASSPAEAAQHLMRINEILLSDNGDNTIQYVELRDPGGEDFPSGNYTLNVFNADGTEIGVVTLSIPNGPPDTTDWYVATAAADAFYTPNGDNVLSASLPVDGQICFQSGTQKIHCVAWGCINTLVTGATAGATSRGASPPDGMSLSRNGSGTYFLGTPTPDANNLAGVPGDFCPTDPDAGVGNPPPDASVPDANPDVPDANPGGGGDDDDDGGGGGGGGGGCCGVGGGDAGGMMLLALATMMLVRRRRA
jgi:hypothetical protein